jgi:ABC-type iron transport system FetAB ATPase subunit
VVELEGCEVSGLDVIDVCCHGRGPYSLRIAPGECVTLRGPSGSGKSLLLRAIADLDPHQGQVSLEGINGTQMPAPEWRRQVALLPVESQWWLDDVGAHFPAEGCEWLEPLGFTTETLGWQVSRLSSGEKQRLALARALVNRPRALLLDEPTASLDPQATAAVEQVVADYRRTASAAVLWVSHDAQQAARVGDRQFSLSTNGLTDDLPERSEKAAS